MRLAGEVAIELQPNDDPTARTELVTEAVRMLVQSMAPLDGKRVELRLMYEAGEAR